MELTPIVAIIGLIVSTVTAVWVYKESKQTKFFQRRDHLFQKISDLNAKNSEAHLISARYEIVAVKRVSLGLRGEQAEDNTAGITSIKELRTKMEQAIKNWDENIEHFHLMCATLTPEKDVARVERLIAMVQVATDNLKKINDSALASLHILEETNTIIRVSLDQINLDLETVRQIDLDLEKATREFNERAPK
jgi:hypothetical protein